MSRRKVQELLSRERHLRRSIDRKKERYEELVAEAMSTGTIRYDQDRETGSAPDGSRQERFVPQYVQIEHEIEYMSRVLEETRTMLGKLIGELPERERRIMKARHMEHREIEDIMKQFGITYETYKVYHKTAIRRMEKKLLEESIANIPQI